MTDNLLQTKLFIPPTRQALVSRPRLVQKLIDGMHSQLTLVCAPAGFGKTTLVASWIAQTDRPFVWLSLDEDDNDVSTLFIYLAAAIVSIDGTGNSLSTLTRGSQPQPPKSLAIAFINDVTGAQSCGVVLDDYHVITNPAIHEAMAFILDHLPPTVHLVMTSRVDPLLPLPRLRARGELTEIRTGDLRFSMEETANFLSGRTAFPLSSQMLAALDRRTEGWIAGIHMAALSIQRMTDVDEAAQFMHDFAGSHRYVFDYLMDEVLNQQPTEIRNFLLQTSVLDRFCAPLCDALFENTYEKTLENNLVEDEGHENADSKTSMRMAPRSQTVLTDLEQTNLFIVPLDDERRWYRYHHLFRDLLRQRLTETDAAAMPLLYERASQWYEAQGERETAFHYARRGGHATLAARLLDEIALTFISNSQLAKLFTLVGFVAETERPKYVRLCLAQAWAYILSGQYERAELAIPHAEAHLKQSENLPPDMPKSLLVATIAALRAYIATRTSRLDDALHQSDLALAALDNPDLAGVEVEQIDYSRGFILLNLGITHYQLGDDAEAAEQAYLAALPFNRNHPFARIATYSNFMRLRQSQGRFDEAIALGQEGLHWIEAQGGAHFPAEAEIRERLVAIYTERNDLAVAAKAMIMLNGDHYLSSSNVIVRSHLSAFLLHLAQGNFEDATTVLGQAEAQFNQQDIQSQNGRAALMHMKLELWRVHGSEPPFLAEARRWMETAGLTAEDSFPYRDELIYVTLAQILLVLGELESALSLMKQFCTRAEKAQRLGDLVGHQVVYAVALDAAHQRTQALAILEQALSLGEQIGAVRSFVDEGAPLHTLLRTLPSTPYRNQILGAFGELTKAALPTTEQNLIEPLSQRELEVLQLLAGGYANQEIAGELIIALSTVKRHVSNIYGKLDVNNRTTAVARARELDLL